MRIICFGVREYELQIIDRIKSESGFQIDVSDIYLNDSNCFVAYGYDAIIIRANCILSEIGLSDLKTNGLKYILTRTVGFNHIDVSACNKLGIRVANAPGYSPNSIAELNLSLSLSLFRNIPEAITNSEKFDFSLNNRMFGKEIKDCTIGIIGCGRIGLQTAKLYHSLGAVVLGFDSAISKSLDSFVEFVDLEYLLKNSDIVSINMSYSKNNNYHFLDEHKLSLMKPGSIVINTARGELIDTEALIKKIKEEKIFGAGLDVVEDEDRLFFKKQKEECISKIHRELISLFPRVIITPHISSSTDKAVYESLLISINNLKAFIAGDKCDNELFSN